jgi:3alpha(or 20beta)-hydroxysteroid dehydrogenase
MGYEIVELFARERAITYAGDIATPERPHSDGVGSVRLEVSREEDWAGAVETILDKHGRIDVLVKNAGSIAHEPLDALDLAGWQRVIAVNQTGVFLGMLAAWERSHLIDKCGGRL